MCVASGARVDASARSWAQKLPRAENSALKNIALQPHAAQTSENASMCSDAWQFVASGKHSSAAGRTGKNFSRANIARPARSLAESYT